MKKIICYFRGHKWSQWYPWTEFCVHYRYCSVCGKAQLGSILGGIRDMTPKEKHVQRSNMNRLPDEGSVSMWSERINNMEKRGMRLAAFVVFLFIVAFSSLGVAGQYIWYENRVLFWVVVISVPLAFLLKRKVNSMEREVEHLKTLDAEDYDKPPVLFSYLSVDELLKMKDVWKSNKRVVTMIDGIIEERKKGEKEFEG